MEGCFSKPAIANDALRRRIAGCTGQCCEREGSAVPASVLSSIPSPARLCQSKFFSPDIIEGHTRQRGRARAEWNHLSRAHNGGLGKPDEIEGGATYCQTSNPSLSNSTSTTSEDKWKCVVRVWGRGEGEGRGPAGQATFAAFAVTRADPALRKAFRGANRKCTQRPATGPRSGCFACLLPL
jgi:hypothetical protein